jgi:arylsulfatase A-like enzyme
MNRHINCCSVVLFVFWWFLFVADAATARKNERNPHILMIVVDDLGSHDLGIHGSGIHTPNADALATSGVYLDQYYVLPYCSPTRAALLSGKYPLHTGLHSVVAPRSTAGLPLRDETLADLLKRAGYHTNAIGKWHIGHSQWQQTPTFRGFDEFFGLYYGAEGYFSHVHDGGYDLRHDGRPRCGRNCSRTVDERGHYSSPLFARETIRMMREYVASTTKHETSGPLFQYLAFQAVHCPNQVPMDYVDRYADRSDWSDQRKVYAGMLTAADDSIGEVVRAYQEAGIWNDTLVIFTTDNGGPTTVGCTTGASNYPKRGGKTTLWEGGCTGDGFVSGPALSNRFGVAGGTRFPHLFHVVDWMPSIAAWVGVVPLHPAELDGRSHAENLRQHDLPPARTELFIGFVEEHTETDSGPWFGPSLRHLNWKIVQGTSAGADENDPHPAGTAHPMSGGMANASYLLFDLDTDPGEMVNLAKEYPDVLNDMMFKLRLYQQSYVPPQINNDSACKWPGFVQDPKVGPTW